MTMTPERLTIGAMLRTRYPLLVPPYQRAYAWERDEVTDFVSDVQGLAKVREGGEQPRSQFFGGVVSVYEVVPGSTAGGEYRVVDGQQRLATFTLTIASILRAYQAVAGQAKRDGDVSTESEALAYSTVERKQLLEFDEVSAAHTMTRLRLRLSKVDDEYFADLVGGKRSVPGAIASHRRLAYADRRIDRELVRPIVMDTARSPKQKLDALRNLLASLVDDCICIHIISQEPTEAYRLFATMNDRGRALTDGDLLRTRTLELLEGWPDHQVAIEEAWQTVLAGSYTEVDKFLRDRYASVVGVRAPSRDLFDRYRERFLPEGAPTTSDEADAMVAFVRRLRDEARFYQRLRAGEWPYDDSTVLQWKRDRLARLVVTLGQETCLPLLLSLRCEASEVAFVDSLIHMERLSFRYLVTGAHAGTLGDEYYKHAASVRSNPGAFSVDTFVSDIEELVGRVAPDDVFRSSIRSRVRYSTTTAQRKIVKHLLTTLDDYYPWKREDVTGDLVPTAMGHYDLDAIEIEHIYPQNPPASERVPALEDVKHDLGNLTFWDPSDNKDAGNGSYAGVKRPLYEASKVELNKHLAKVYLTWTRDDLEQRTNELVDATLAIYDVKQAAPSAPADEEAAQEEELLVDPLGARQ